MLNIFAQSEYVNQIHQAIGYLNHVIHYNIDDLLIDNGNNNYQNTIPNYLYSYVYSIADNTEYDFLSILMWLLSIFSISLNGKYVVRCDNTWIEQIGLYLLLMAKSGSRKSSFIDTIKNLLVITNKNFNKNCEYDIKNKKNNLNDRKELIKARESINTDIINEGKTGKFNFDIDKLNTLKKQNDEQFNEEIKKIDDLLSVKRSDLFIDNFTRIGLLKK
jgi:hypothetical protein